VEVAEDGSLGGEPVEVGGLEVFGAENADVGVALIVSENNDDVG
jgi:hypothetical protein